MHFLHSIVLAFGAHLAFCYTVLCSPTVVDHSFGVTYSGFSVHGVEKFLSISYGQDTGGKNRFSAPVSFIPNNGSVINATTPGPACPQPLGGADPPLSLTNVTDISEDCLQLNVARPAGTHANAKLAVMVYIYGGKPSWVEEC